MLIHDTTSCGIDDVSALLHGSHLFCSDHVSCLICQRQVHGNNVCIFDNLIDRRKRYKRLELFRYFFYVRIICQYFHAKAVGSSCHILCDRTEAENTQCLEAYVHTDGRFPLPVSDTVVCNHNISCHRQHKANGQVSNGI